MPKSTLMECYGAGLTTEWIRGAGFLQGGSPPCQSFLPSKLTLPVFPKRERESYFLSLPTERFPGFPPQGSKVRRWRCSLPMAARYPPNCRSIAKVSNASLTR